MDAPPTNGSLYSIWSVLKYLINLFNTFPFAPGYLRGDIFEIIPCSFVNLLERVSHLVPL